jgi:hypothetical protein
VEKSRNAAKKNAVETEITKNKGLVTLPPLQESQDHVSAGNGLMLVMESGRPSMGQH